MATAKVGMILYGYCNGYFGVECAELCYAEMQRVLKGDKSVKNIVNPNNDDDEMLEQRFLKRYTN